MKEYCEQTGKQMAKEFGLEFTGTMKVEEKEEYEY
jgi:hypothetical protein